LTEHEKAPSRRILARIAWIVPAVLLALSIYEAKVARDLAVTAERGVPAVAKVTRYLRADRKDVTEAELDLIITLPDGSTIRRDKLTLPYSIAHRVEQDTLDVRVLRGSGQEVVISSIVGTQTRIAWSNAGMSLIAMLMAIAGVVAWNRFPVRETPEDTDGDPALARAGAGRM